MDGQFPRDQFLFIWRNISLDKSLLLEDFDDSISHEEDGEFDNDDHEQGYEGSFSSGNFSQDPTDDDDYDDDVVDDDSTDVDDDDDGIDLETVTEEDKHEDNHEALKISGTTRRSLCSIG